MKIAYQCKDSLSGKTGTFLFVESHPSKAIGKVYKDSAELFNSEEYRTAVKLGLVSRTSL